MESLVYLNIDTSEGLLFIPFLGLRELDYFTVGYENQEELITSLNQLLDLSIMPSDVKNVYISSEMYKKSDKRSLSHIKYRGNNFNLESLCEMFSLYLKQDRRRIRKDNIRNVAVDGMERPAGDKLICDKDIDLAVRLFFDEDYKNQRDAYFLIKDSIPVKIDLLPNASRFTNPLQLYQLEAEKDDFYQYLVELSSRGTEELEIALDELSKSNLEDIRKAYQKNYYGVVDGLGDRNLITLEDAYLLEYCTGMKINAIQDLLFEFRTETFFGRKR